jgi:hypothetical protein
MPSICIYYEFLCIARICVFLPPLYKYHILHQICSWPNKTHEEGRTYRLRQKIPKIYQAL